ncbi:helix-turn-helix transcriptional regulator [Roseovarius sp. D22-M7]|uniref:helix-turn-helix transcriptional regulator n=1 Tax=Roseovarius sp. D22-M7 TaxID=3127116 RepID=UPI00300FCE22
MNNVDTIKDIALAAINAATHPDQWTPLCDVIAESLDAKAFMVFAYDLEKHGTSVSHVSARLRSAEAVALLNEVQDGTATEDAPGYEAISKTATGHVIGERDAFAEAPDGPLPTNGFRERALAITGARSRSAVKLNMLGPFLDCAISHDVEPGGQPSKSMQQAAPFLVPILSRTLESTRVVTALTRSYAGLLSLFDRLDFGAVFCHPSGLVMNANRTFSEMVAEKDGLSYGGGRIQSILPSNNPSLDAALKSAMRPTAGPDPLTFTLSRRSGSLPFVCHVMPVNETDVAHDTLLLLLVIDPESSARISAQGLAAFGALSPAELDVCHFLVRGFSTDRIAELRDTSPETARGQIKAAAAKLACRGRMDLLRLAMVSSFPLRDDCVYPPSGG